MDIVSVLEQVTNEERGIELAVLFGSHSTGRASPESDVDFGIRWASGVSRTEQERVLDRVERAVSAPVDAIGLDDAPPLLRMEIARSGIVIQERTPAAWSEFRARAMLDWWDFAPYARLMQRAARARLEDAVRGTR